MILSSSYHNFIKPFINKDKNNSTEKIPYIFSDIYPQIDLNGIISISFSNDHIIWIAQDGIVYAMGDNSKGQINGSFRKKVFTKPTKIIFEDDKLKFSSVICGIDYALYLTASANPQLLYVNSDFNTIIKRSTTSGTFWWSI